MPCGTAVIPATRVDDFLFGWGAEAGTNLPVQRRNCNLACGGLRTEFMCQRATVDRKPKEPTGDTRSRAPAQLKGVQELLKCRCKAKCVPGSPGSVTPQAWFLHHSLPPLVRAPQQPEDGFAIGWTTFWATGAAAGAGAATAAVGGGAVRVFEMC